MTKQDKRNGRRSLCGGRFELAAEGEKMKKTIQLHITTSTLSGQVKISRSEKILEQMGKATAGEAMAKPLKNASLPQLNITRFTLPCQDELKILRIKESL